MVSTSEWRSVEVGVDRLAGWLDRFAARHGPLTWAVVDEQTLLTAPDGARASIELPGPPGPAPDRASLLAAGQAFDAFGLVLVRRGGFAVGRVAGATLVGSRCGTRYVQGKTKAGGWSQQRYARRRARQAETVVQAAASAVSVVLAADPSPLVGGGDKEMVRSALRLATRLEPVCRWLDVPDPRRAVLVAAVDRARAARIRVNELA